MKRKRYAKSWIDLCWFQIGFCVNLILHKFYGFINKTKKSYIYFQWTIQVVYTCNCARFIVAPIRSHTKPNQTTLKHSFMHPSKDIIILNVVTSVTGCYASNIHRYNHSTVRTRTLDEIYDFHLVLWLLPFSLSYSPFPSSSSLTHSLSLSLVPSSPLALLSPFIFHLCRRKSDKK